MINMILMPFDERVSYHQVEKLLPTFGECVCVCARVDVFIFSVHSLLLTCLCCLDFSK